jgi:hypothetical protein
MTKSHKYREIGQILDIPIHPVQGSSSFLQVLQSPKGDINNGLEYYKKYLKYSGIHIYQGHPYMECIPRQIVKPQPVQRHSPYSVHRRSILPPGHKTYTSKKSPKTLFRKIMGMSPNNTRKSPKKSPKNHQLHLSTHN